MSTDEPVDQHRSEEPAESGYGLPTPEQEMPADAATNPGSPDPTIDGQETDQEALSSDTSLGAPEQNFFEAEDAGSDGEPGAGRFGGTDDQLNEELASSDADAARLDPRDESPAELPSADAPMDDGNSESASNQRESFSSEPTENA